MYTRTECVRAREKIGKVNAMLSTEMLFIQLWFLIKTDSAFGMNLISALLRLYFLSSKQTNCIHFPQQCNKLQNINSTDSSVYPYENVSIEEKMNIYHIEVILHPVYLSIYLSLLLFLFHFLHFRPVYHLSATLEHTFIIHSFIQSFIRLALSPLLYRNEFSDYNSVNSIVEKSIKWTLLWIALYIIAAYEHRIRYESVRLLFAHALQSSTHMNNVTFEICS